MKNTNQNRNDIFESFLMKSIEPNFFDIFVQAFHSIDQQGYFDNSFYEKSVVINGHQTKIGQIKQSSSASLLQ